MKKLKEPNDMTVAEIKTELLGEFRGKTDKQVDAILNPTFSEFKPRDLSGYFCPNCKSRKVNFAKKIGRKMIYRCADCDAQIERSSSTVGR